MSAQERPVRALFRKLGQATITSWSEATNRELEGPVFQRDTAYLEKILPLMALWSRYFGAEVRGLDALPAGGPYLLVGNHSGGMWTPDTAALYAAWYQQRGLDDVLTGLAFDAAFGIPKARELMRKIGQIPASMDNAERALGEGHSVLVYPGGAYEVFRPFSERNRILLHGRKGFVRLALRTGVPVVPVVGHGGHETTVVLSRGERIAKLLGMDKLRVEVWPVLLQFPWGVSTPVLPPVPLPAKITVEVGAPLDMAALCGSDDPDDEDAVQRGYAAIEARMQGTLDRLAEENPFPLKTRLRDWGLL